MEISKWALLRPVSSWIGAREIRSYGRCSQIVNPPQLRTEPRSVHPSTRSSMLVDLSPLLNMMDTHASESRPPSSQLARLEVPPCTCPHPESVPHPRSTSVDRDGSTPVSVREPSLRQWPSKRSARRSPGQHFSQSPSLRSSCQVRAVRAGPDLHESWCAPPTEMVEREPRGHQ